MAITVHLSVLRKFFCLLFLGLGLYPAYAATIRVPADQPTIQASIDAASTGDTVLVAPGTYYENIDFKGKAITVTSSDGAAKTIIDGGGATLPVVLFTHQETRTSILNGFTIQDGGGTPEISGPDGGIYINTSSPTILNNVLTQNFCRSIHSYFGSPLIQGNSINNTLDPNGLCSFAGGSAIWLESSLQPTLGSSHTTPIFPVVTGNVIENNTQSGKEDAGGNGGAGIAVWNGNAVVIENNVIRNNISNGGTGGGINIESGGAYIIQNLIYGNKAGGGGGALSLDSTNGPIVSYVANNTIVDNTFTICDGNCQTVSQINYGPFGGSSAVTVNNIIAGNTAIPSIQCGSIGIPNSAYNGNMLIFDHNLFYNSGGPVFSNNCFAETEGYGNLNANPQFVNQAAGNYHLQSTSPAIDAGNTSSIAFLTTNSLTLPQDIDGNARLQDYTGKTYPVIDIGTYEFAGMQDANATTILLTPSTYELNASAPLTFTAKLLSANGTPTGTVNLLEDGVPVATALIDSTGSTTMQTAGLVPGIHDFTATYSGQGSFTPATSVKVIVLVDKYVTIVQLTTTPNPNTLTQPVTLNATIGSPDNAVLGPITFTDDYIGMNLSNLPIFSPASFTVTFAVGTHILTANYAGDATHLPSSATVTQHVLPGFPTTTTLVSSPNPANYGQSVMFMTTVSSPTSTSGGPTGTITLFDGDSFLITMRLTPHSTSSTALGSVNGLTAGTHSISATYTPTGDFASSNTTISQTIIGIPTTSVLISSQSPVYFGQTVTFTSTVTSSASEPPPTGTVAFTYGGSAIIGTKILTPISSTTSTASISTSSLPVGAQSIQASYNPTGRFAGSVASITEVVQPAPISTLTASPNPAVVGQNITITAFFTSFTGIAAGSVTFYDGATSLSVVTIDSTGHATFTTNSLAVGTHSLQANFQLPGLYPPATTATFTETILSAPTPDFTLTPTNPTLTLQTKHHLTTTAAFASIGGFTDTLNLRCSNLPAHLTCAFAPTATSLGANGNATISLYLDTAASGTTSAIRHTSPFTLALLLSPASLLAGIGIFRRRRTPLRLLLLLLAILPAAFTLGGCGGPVTIPTVRIPSVSPGTYTIPITATGVATGLSHTAQITLTVTP